MEILNFADYDSLIIPEPLWREIKDIKRCNTCKHWREHQRLDAPRCEIWHNDEELSEGEGKNVLDCWERKQ
jgi:hypothetical protein